MKLFISGERNTFQFAIWRVETENRPIIIVGVYHLLTSERFPHSNSQFIDGFLDFHGSISVKYKNIMILGDFDIHMKYFHT